MILQEEIERIGCTKTQLSLIYNESGFNFQ